MSSSCAGDHRLGAALGSEAIRRIPADALTDEALAASYRSVFDALDEAFCIIEIVYDHQGQAVDYRFIEANRAFGEHTGLHDVIGKTALELVPCLERHWIDTYAEVARSGDAVRLTQAAEQLGRWLDVYAWRFGIPTSRRVAVHFTDITARKTAEDELRHRSEQFHALIQRAPIGIYLIDRDFRIIEANPIAQQAFGDVPDLIGRDFEQFIGTIWPRSLVERSMQVFRRTLETGVTYHEPEVAEVRSDRRVTEYYDWRTERIRLPDGSYGVVCYFNDISAQVTARRALAASEERYRTLFESIDEGFCILKVTFDEDDRPIDYHFIEANPAFERHTGLENALGRSARELLPDLEPSWYQTYGGVALTGQPRRFVAQTQGRWYDEFAFRIGAPLERKVAVLFSDITKRKRTEHALRESVALLRHHAQHDPLTGLPNRILLEDRLRSAVAAAEMHQRTFGVLFIDLDGFKAINDELGHASGDVVLTEVAYRLRQSLRAGDTLARIHGDEFVALLPELSGRDEAESLAQQLLEVLTDPIDVAATTVSLQASIGVSLFPNDAADARALLRAADAAMYRVKLAGKNAVSRVLEADDGGGPTGEAA